MTVLHNLSPVKTATQGRFKELYLTFSFFHGLLRNHLNVTYKYRFFTPLNYDQ